MEKFVKTFEECKIECEKCKSMCIEKGETSLLTICELCILACTEMCMCLRRPSQCSSNLQNEIKKHCQAIVKECMIQCKKHGRVKCATACEKAHNCCSHMKR